MGTDADTSQCTLTAGETGRGSCRTQRVTVDLDQGMVVYNSISQRRLICSCRQVASSVPRFILQSK